MKKHILALLGSLALTAAAFAHGEVEVGPNGGRILEFSKNETMHGEVTVKGGKFHIAAARQGHEARRARRTDAHRHRPATGTKPEKLAVEKDGGHFVVPIVKAGEWLIVQFKDNAKAKAVTARLQYDTKVCGSCKKRGVALQMRAGRAEEGKVASLPPAILPRQAGLNGAVRAAWSPANEHRAQLRDAPR